MIADLNCFDDNISELEKLPYRKNQILFYGSSTFTFWGHEKIKSDLDGFGLDIINHGFGGSTAEQALYYYNRMVKPYEPKILVWYEGDNDIACGYTPEEAFFISERVFAWFRKDFPDSKLCLLGVKHSPCRKSLFPQMDKYNAMLENYADGHDYADYIDMNSILYIDTAEYGNCDKINASLFMEDMLHYNDKGYEKLTKIVKFSIGKFI